MRKPVRAGYFGRADGRGSDRGISRWTTFSWYRSAPAHVLGRCLRPAVEEATELNQKLDWAEGDVRIESTIFLIVIVSAMIASLTTFLFLNSSEVSIYIFGFAMFSLLINESLGRKNYRKYSWCFFSQRILAIILSLTLYHIIGIEGIILGYAFSFFPFFIFIYKTLRDVPINFTLLRPRSGFMMTNYAITLLHSFSIKLDKLIILPMFGAALLGNYFLGFQIFYALLLIPSTVFIV